MEKRELIKKDEQIDILVEQIKAIMVESVFSSRMTLLEGKHLIGKTIVESSLYKENKKGAGDIIKNVAEKIGRSERDIYLCVQFYKEYKEIARLVQKLKGKKNDITWAATRRLLEGKEKEICQHKLEKIEAWQCKKCGTLLKSKP